jgi:hypothetical protein
VHEDVLKRPLRPDVKSRMRSEQRLPRLVIHQVPIANGDERNPLCRLETPTCGFDSLRVASNADHCGAQFKRQNCSDPLRVCRALDDDEETALKQFDRVDAEIVEQCKSIAFVIET